MLLPPRAAARAGYSRSHVMMRLPTPQPPAPLSPLLLLGDGSVLLCYSLSSSITGLFRAEEYLEPPALLQDIVDISLAFDQAGALALGWILASLATGATSHRWLALPWEEHQRSALGVNKLLPTWMLAWPLFEMMKVVAASQLASWSTVALATDLPQLAQLSSVQTLATDGAGLLLIIALWRSWLLRWWNRW